MYKDLISLGRIKQIFKNHGSNFDADPEPDIDLKNLGSTLRFTDFNKANKPIF